MKKLYIGDGVYVEFDGYGTGGETRTNPMIYQAQDVPPISMRA